MKNTTATAYLIKSLRQLIVDFPKIRIRYEFDELANIHCVEVVPNEIYTHSEEYVNWENEFTDKFTEKFPSQCVCFFSQDNPVGIQEIHLELQGSEFN